MPRRTDGRPRERARSEIRQVNARFSRTHQTLLRRRQTLRVATSFALFDSLPAGAGTTRQMALCTLYALDLSRLVFIHFISSSQNNISYRISCTNILSQIPHYLLTNEMFSKYIYDSKSFDYASVCRTNKRFYVYKFVVFF